jgi:hypothetical protein
MHYLLLMDGLRENAAWIALAFLVCLAGLLIWAPRMSNSWRRKAVRTLGTVLLVLLAIVAAPLLFFACTESPTRHFVFKSADGSRVALLSHSELRDGAHTEVTVNVDGCCNRYIAYRYYGDGSDYMGAQSVEWLDAHHLAIRYVRDVSVEQECRSRVADIEILCDLQPDPFPRQ